MSTSCFLLNSRYEVSTDSTTVVAIYLNLTFRTTNPVYRPIVDGIVLVRKYLNKKNVCYPETEHIHEELLSRIWEKMGFEKDKDVTRIVKHYFELCVLQKLEKALKTKKVLAVVSCRYRNPDQDLPQDWAKIGINYCRITSSGSTPLNLWHNASIQ